MVATNVVLLGTTGCQQVPSEGARTDRADARDVAVASDRDDGWVGGWATAPHGSIAFEKSTLRMIFRPTVATAPSGGEVAGPQKVRVRLSNAYGVGAAHIEGVRIARRTTGPAIEASSERTVLFEGREGLVLPPEGEAVSDPVDFGYRAGDDVAVTFYVNEASSLAQHANAYAFTYVAGGTSALDDADGLSFTSVTTSWFGALGLDVLRPGLPGTFVALGDSITDGQQPSGVNNRWPDYFAERLRAQGVELGILNEGIGANKVTEDATDLAVSEAAVKRFDRDVLERPNVATVLIFAGTNDLAQGVDADTVFAGLADMAGRAHDRGLYVVGGTITPRGKDPVWQLDASFEAERLRLNALIRDGEGQVFDDVADFDAALAAPLAPQFMSPEYDSGDGLHPSPLGLRAIADAVPLDFLDAQGASLPR